MDEDIAKRFDFSELRHSLHIDSASRLPTHQWTSLSKSQDVENHTAALSAGLQFAPLDMPILNQCNRDSGIGPAGLTLSRPHVA
jgi:hypothetical protein